LASVNDLDAKKQLDAIVKLAPMLRAVLIGAFAIGGWVAGLQFSFSQQGQRVDRLEQKLSAFEDMQRDMAVMRNDIAWMRTRMEESKGAPR
jgi:hypothetical protein